MEFADLDDDLFCEERHRNNIDEEYAARFCSDCWFLEVPPDQLVSEEDKLGVQKHSADYLFFKKKYSDSMKKYAEILNIVPAGNTTVKRECYEGVARSYIKMGKPDQAVEFAEKLHSTSKTLEQATVSYAVLVDSNIASERYLEALKASQSLVSIHPFSSDAWLKLAYIYACMYGLELPNVKELLISTFTDKHHVEKQSGDVSFFHKNKYKIKKATQIFQNKLEKQKHTLVTNSGEDSDDESNSYKKNESSDSGLHVGKGVQFVCASLYRSFLILKRTEGTTFGFALDSSLMLQRKILSDISILLDEEALNLIKSNVNKCDHAFYGGLPLKETTPEFEKNLSQFQPDETEDDVNISVKSFEIQWFNWLR